MESENLLPPQELGMPSVIKSYCEQAMDTHGKDSECIWVCIKRRQRWIAQDVKLSERPLDVYELRRLCGWWKRHSLFSAIGVREVKIRFLNVKVSSHEVEVVLKDFGHSSIEADFEREIAKTLSPLPSDPDKLTSKEHRRQEFPKWEIDIMGVRHPATNLICPYKCECGRHDYNDRYMTSKLNSSSSRFVQRLDDICHLREESRWLPAMLEFYWRCGVGQKAIIFLKGTGFVWKYRDLEYDTYQDAANPYGKTINAFQVIEGWRITYLLLLVGASVALSICVVAIAAIASKGDLGVALTAGSFVLAAATVALAGLSLLSAVL